MFIDRVDKFLSLFERYVVVAESDHARAVERDEIMQATLARHAEAAENLASTSHAQTAISRKSVEVLERSIPPRFDGESE